MRNAIERILDKSDLPVYLKDLVAELFERCWYRYYLEGRDTHFDVVELRDFWFYTRILLLIKMDTREAAEKLTRELNLNAKKFENMEYRVQEVYRENI